MAHASPTPCIRFGVRFKAVAFRTSVLKQVNFSSQGELSERSLRHRCAKNFCSLSLTPTELGENKEAEGCEGVMSKR